MCLSALIRRQQAKGATGITQKLLGTAYYGSLTHRTVQVTRETAKKSGLSTFEFAWKTAKGPVSKVVAASIKRSNACFCGLVCLLHLYNSGAQESHHSQTSDELASSPMALSRQDWVIEVMDHIINNNGELTSKDREALLDR